MNSEHVYLTLSENVYHDLSMRPFELVPFEYFSKTYRLRGNCLKEQVVNARAFLPQDHEIFGVWGQGYMLTLSPLEVGTIVTVKGIRPFRWEELGNNPVRENEIFDLVTKVQKGMVHNKLFITPVIPDREYKLLVRFIKAYAHDRVISTKKMPYGEQQYFYTIKHRLIRVLHLATDDQWVITKDHRKDYEFFLKQNAEGQTYE
jgi:hypothetical protein